MIVTFVALAALTFSTPAATPDSDQVPLTRTVHMNDLNLATAHGQRAAKQRLAYAINEVCPNEDPSDMMPTAEVRRCRNKAWAQANQQLDVEIARADARGDNQLASR